MDIWQQISKKLTSSEKKINNKLANCRLSKALRQAAATPVSTQPITPTSEFCDPGILVARPPPTLRLVLFKELGDGERPILFDSKCFEKAEPPCVEKYRYIRTPSDWKVLKEMLFGSVGMTQKAASLKIHFIKSPPSIMLSRVFCLSSKESATASLDRGIENTFEMHRANSVLSRRKANTMPVPLPPTGLSHSLASSLTSQSGGHFPRSDSGISLSSISSSSFQPSTPGYPFGSLSSSVALTSSGSHGKSNSLPQNKRDCFSVSEELAPNEKFLRRARTKRGFAIICTPEPSDFAEFQRFIFEHFPIIESHLAALTENIDKAFQLKPRVNFFELMMKALDEFTSKLHAVYCSQRLPEPVWATLTTPSLLPGHRQIVVESFVADLTRLVSDYNTKQHFVTSLLTAVLTYHLGWVTSVTPTSAKDCDGLEEEYNALWAQLGDLYGAVGYPTKICRTVVTGGCHELVSTFLSVLSYFIRSSRIDNVIKVPSKINPYTLGIEQPPPDLKVTVEMIPCDLDDAEEYVFISVVDEDDKHEEDAKEETAASSREASASKNPVLRSKSSPHKPKVESEEEEEESSLTRSQSGPMIKRGHRPRSNAIVGNRFSTRHRTFSNNILSKPRGVQSRRRLHDTNDAVVTSSNNLRHSFSRTSESDSNKTLTNLKTEGSFCIKQNAEFDEDFVSTFNSKDSGFPNSADFPECEIRKTQSYVDLVEPKIEKVINVQRSYIEASFNDRPTSLFVPVKNNNHSAHVKVDSEAEEDFAIDYRPTFFLTDDENINSSENISKRNNREPAPKKQSLRNSKTKLGARRRQLPLEAASMTDKTMWRSESSINDAPSCDYQKLKYLRIPSVEMDHNTFEEYLDHETPTSDFNAWKGSECESEKKEVLPLSPPHHVISCPNFNARQNNRTSSSSCSTASKKIESIYPTLDFNAEINSESKNIESVAMKLYPTLPQEPYDSVKFSASREKVSFGRQNSNRPNSFLPVENLPPKSGPSRMNSSQSSRTVTDDFMFNDQLHELPLADIEITDLKEVSEKEYNMSTGYTSLLADYGQEYMNDFILHGAPNSADMHKKILSDLEHSCKNSTLDEMVSESICVVADTDSWSVKVYRSHRLHEDPPCLPALTSKLVGNILNRVAVMAKLKMSAEFCMAQLESELRQLVLKSHVLAEYTLGRKRVTMSQLSAALNIESQDLPLLMSIASCHSPHLARMMLVT